MVKKLQPSQGATPAILKNVQKKVPVPRSAMKERKNLTQLKSECIQVFTAEAKQLAKKAAANVATASTEHQAGTDVLTTMKTIAERADASVATIKSKRDGVAQTLQWCDDSVGELLRFIQEKTKSMEAQQEEAKKRWLALQSNAKAKLASDISNALKA